uniref:Uncharacterized protein n=1 Tax=Timema poppense TaxID=170557 RepID=A0A7R9CRJ4_TIMPO|nr:unnamed protein product [Timema poppensis]
MARCTQDVPAVEKVESAHCAPVEDLELRGWKAPAVDQRGLPGRDSAKGKRRGGKIDPITPLEGRACVTAKRDKRKGGIGALLCELTHVSSAHWEFRSQSMKDKAICYIIVLGLIVSNYQLDLTTLIESSKVGLNKLIQLSRAVGASLKNKTKDVVVLKLPLPPMKVFYLNNFHSNITKTRLCTSHCKAKSKCAGHVPSWNYICKKTQRTWKERIKVGEHIRITKEGDTHNNISFYNKLQTTGKFWD